MALRELIWVDAGIVRVSRFDYLEIDHVPYCGIALPVGEVKDPFQKKLKLTFKSDSKAEDSGFNITYKQELIRE